MNNDIRNLSKWLNEEQETPLDHQALARVLAMAEQPAQQRHISYACPQCHWSLEEQPAQRKPLTDEFLRKLHHEDQFGLFCDYDEFEQIARAIEAAHGIK